MARKRNLSGYKDQLTEHTFILFFFIKIIQLLSHNDIIQKMYKMQN